MGASVVTKSILLFAGVHLSPETELVSNLGDCYTQSWHTLATERDISLLTFMIDPQLLTYKLTFVYVNTRKLVLLYGHKK